MENEEGPSGPLGPNTNQQTSGTNWGVVILGVVVLIAVLIALFVALIYLEVIPMPNIPGLGLGGSEEPVKEIGEHKLDGCVKPDEDNQVDSSKVEGNSWTIMTWYRHNDDPDNMLEEKVIMSKSGSPQFKLEEVRFLDTFNAIVKFQWHTQDGTKLETKENAFIDKTIDSNNRPIDEWKHYAWVHNNGRNIFYEDAKIIYEIPDPADFKLNEGDIQFSGDAMFSKVCSRSIPSSKIKEVYNHELKNFKRKENMKNNLVKVGLQ